MSTSIGEVWINNKKLLSFMVPLIVSFGIGIGTGMARSFHSTSTKQCVVNTSDRPYFSLADYNRIEVNDDLEKVELILGVGIEKSRSSSESVHIWVNPNQPSIQGRFDNNGILQEKKLVDIPLEGCIAKLPG